MIKRFLKRHNLDSFEAWVMGLALLAFGLEVANYYLGMVLHG